MKVQQFVDTAYDIATKYKTQYKLGGIGEHNGDLWYFDCVGLIKSIYWGWCGDTNYSRGGAVYASNGLPDVGANKLFSDYCTNKSTDFTKIEVGELVWMDGHIGIYLGNRKVIEATSAWDNKVLISDIGNNGERTYYGRQVYSWTHHGKFNLLDYTPVYKYKVGDKVILDGWTHKTSQANSETTGEYHDYLTKIDKIENGEYPYHLENLGWCREKYLSPYTGTDYEQLYKQELLKNKDLQKQVDNLQGKINKAMEDLK